MGEGPGLPPCPGQRGGELPLELVGQLRGEAEGGGDTATGSDEGP